MPAGFISVFLVSLAVVAGEVSEASGGNVRSLTIIAGAESHGMIEACDCENEPGGGVAKRSSLLASLGDRDSLLLLDAGGFSAGGIYDDYTRGRAEDSLRTVAMIRAMGTMRYDAAAIGDDDLQYGGKWLVARAGKAKLPLVCANCFLDGKKRLASPYRIVSKAGIKIGITAVTTTERLFPVDSRITVTDPVAALDGIWKELLEKSDVRIILAHLGQEKAASLADRFEECDLIVNGHRKSDRKAAAIAGTTPVMQFGFQGKSLSAVRLQWDGETARFGSAKWYDVAPELPDDASMAALFRRKKSTGIRNNIYDLYIMSQCSFGIEALDNFMVFAGYDRSIMFNIWFIGSVEHDTLLSSLHGEEEVEEERRWLAVKNLYPERWYDFLRIRSASDEPIGTIFRNLDFNVTDIDRWARTRGTAELKRHYNRSARLDINASPTLVINNRPYNGEIVPLDLLRYHCGSVASPGVYCDSLPECGDDSHCRATGKLGRCVKGTCEYRDAVPFVFTVLYNKETFRHPEEKVIRTTLELFPGAHVKKAHIADDDGRALEKEYRPGSLPFYLFGKEVRLTHNFSSVEKGLVNLGEAYTFREGVVPVNYIPARKPVEGERVLMADPFFHGLPDLLRYISADSLYRRSVVVKPVIYADPAAVRPGTEEWFRQEEALRWLVCGGRYRAKMSRYLEAYAGNPGSSYWQVPAREAGISPDSLFAGCRHSRDLLSNHWAAVSAFGIKDPVVMIIDNREIIRIGGERELRRVLSRFVRTAP